MTKEKTRPGLLDIVEIDGRLAQVRPSERCVVFLDEITNGEMIAPEKIHEIRWDDYDFMGFDNVFYVGDLRKRSMITDEQYMAVRWGPEQDEYPLLRDGVTYSGRYESPKSCAVNKNG
jgi:hypothetical protein